MKIWPLATVGFLVALGAVVPPARADARAYGTKDGTLALRTFVIAGARVAFLEQDEPPVIISAACRTPAGAFKCDAWTHYQKLQATLSDAEAGAQDGPLAGNPAATLCALERGLKVVARGPSGDEFLFCAFSDGSIISAGSMYAKAVSNSHKVK